MRKRTFSSTRIVLTLLGSCGLIAAILWSLEGTENRAQEHTGLPPGALFETFSRPDAVTADIRDPGRELVRVEVRSPEDGAIISRYGTIIEDLGSSIVMSKDRSVDISRTGLHFQRIETSINLPGAKFDPIVTPPAETVRPDAGSAPSPGYYVVQLGGIATDELLDSIRDAGAEVLQYVPHQAFFVYGDGETIEKLAGHSRIRWVGRYTPEQKISRHVSEFAQTAGGESGTFDVAVFARADLDDVAARLSGRTIARMTLPNNFFNVLRIEMPKEGLMQAAQIPDVIRVDPYIKPVAEDERAAHIVAGNYSSPTVIIGPGYNPLTQFGVDGTNVTVGMVDDGVGIPGAGGFYITSANTVNGPLRGATAGAEGGHGHINASIISGAAPFGVLDPTGHNYGLGIAPKSHIINIPFLKTGNTTTDIQAVDDTFNTLGPNGVRGSITNNSWGAGTNSNAYDSLAAQYDGFVRDATVAAPIDPFTIIFSAGNSGPTALSLTRPKVSKNTIAVANSENVRPETLGTTVIGAVADNMDDLRSSSSRGPTADGRIKPDVTAPGTVITGSRSGTCGSVTGCFDANHAYSTGTSHAAPQVAGAAALFTQFWRDGHSGQYPSPSLIKAAIINTGQEMNGLTTNTATVPNGIEGWGRINLSRMFSSVPTYRDNQTTSFFAPGAGRIYSGRVADTTKPVRFTIVWTDPPATADPALVNNLDMTVTIDGIAYRGNVFSGGVSTTGGSADTINNVENVFLPAGIPAGSTVSISVFATTLNGDGIPGNADTTDQHYSLVAYNFVTGGGNPRSPVDFDGDDRTDLSIFRPSVGEWWYNRSIDGTSRAAQFGTASDQRVPADYTGDQKADIAFWRPSTGEWFVLRSENFTFYSFAFGLNGDVPVPGLYDADGIVDVGIFRPSTATWYLRRGNGTVDIIPFGNSTDIPVPGDYDGDGTTDVAIYRPSNGQWWLRRSTAGVIVFQFGTSTDRLVQGDYTNDGKTDVAFWRPSTGTWFILRSQDLTFYSVPFGISTDLPVPGDYDGDGRFDPAVFRPSSATWFVNRSVAGTLIQTFGLPSDVPVPYAYVR